MDSDSNHEPGFYDVIIVGGSLSGASAAFLLKRRHPSLRVLIIEKSTHFTRRVGEATVELSTYFLGRILGMTQHLNDAHLVKQGMRFWFANENTADLSQASELGGRFQVRLPAYQIDRAVFDEELLSRAQAMGAELLRPANVRRIELAPGATQKIVVAVGGMERTLQSRWVVDASGIASLIARQNGWLHPNIDHPTEAVWARWRGVKDLDGLELAEKYPKWANAPYGIRSTATNHVVGEGWWSWWIPLRGGDYSIGIVMDQRLVNWPKEGRLGDRMRSFLEIHPVSRELISNAHFIEDDVHWRKNLAYSCEVVAGDGFAIVGDAAGFIDPLYSPGMDWISYTVFSTVELITSQVEGELTLAEIADFNRDFNTSYQRWFEAIYRGKYYFIGEFDLVSLAFQMDLGLYYLGLVSQPLRGGPSALTKPPFSTIPSVPIYYIARFYNGRFAKIAEARRERGKNLRTNSCNRCLLDGFKFDSASILKLLFVFAKWGMLELREGWRSWGSRQPARRENVRPALES
jgi:flavin-dependent dehydrogenase